MYTNKFLTKILCPREWPTWYTNVTKWYVMRKKGSKTVLPVSLHFSLTWKPPRAVSWHPWAGGTCQAAIYFPHISSYSRFHFISLPSFTKVPQVLSSIPQTHSYLIPDPHTLICNHLCKGQKKYVKIYWKSDVWLWE